MEGAGVGHDGRGHLDVDDMGRDEGDLVSLEAGDGVRPEVLEGPQGVTWGERLEAAGVTPYLRRHRAVARSALVVLAVLAVVGLVAGGVTAYRFGQPAADDGTIAVTVWETTSRSWEPVSLTNRGTLELSYSLAPKRHGDSMRLLGLLGPGVRASAGSEPVTLVADLRGGDHYLTVIPDCDDPTVLTAQDADYRLQVARTDALGRTVSGLVAVPEGSSVHWPLLIGRACTHQWFDESITTEAVEVSVTRAATGVPALKLDLHLRNTFGTDIFAAYGGGYPSYGGGSVVMLLAGTTTPLSISVPVPDCRSPAKALPDGATNGLDLRGTVMAPESQDDVGDAIDGSLTLRWTPAVAHRIDTMLQALCAGAPPVTVHVVSARQATDNQLTAPHQDFGLPLTVLRLRLRVISPATRVTVSGTATSADTAPGDLVLLTSETAAMHGGVTEVTVDWATACSPQQGPPTVQLMLTSGRRSYPDQVTLADSAMTAGFLRACGLIYTADLKDAGWPIPG